MSLQIASIVSQPFEENTYIAYLDNSAHCLVFDPGFDPEAILKRLEALGLEPAAIINTHGHVDHIAGNAMLKERWPEVPLVIGQGDAQMLADPKKNLSAGYGLSVTSPPADALVDHGQTYSAAGLDLEVRAIPGHSPGHVVFIRHGEPAHVFGGDVLFAGSVGRTDLPGGSFEQLADGIRRHLFTLSDETIVYPGHGPTTTIGQERRTNPFVGEA